MLKRRYLEGAEADQRARFHRLTPADQEHELQSWELTGDRVTYRARSALVEQLEHPA